MPRLTIDALTPLPWQGEALRAILSPRGGCYGWAGGKGSGKSVLLCSAACLLAATRPGVELALVMDSAPSLRDIHLPILATMAPSAGAEWRATSAEFRWPSGSVLRLRHLDMAGDPQSGTSPLEGPSYHAVLMDEGQKVDPRYWLVFQERARADAVDLAGRRCLPLVVTSGLPIGTWWCTETERAGGRVWRPRTRDNAANLADGYEDRLRASMTERRARAFLDGEEYTPEGQIVEEYRAAPEPAGCWTDWRPDYRNARTLLAMDLGLNNPHALLLVEDAERGRWVVMREWYSSGRPITIGEFCRRISRDAVPRRLWDAKSGQAPIDEVVADPAGAAASAQTGHSDLDLIAMAPASGGLGMRPVIETIPERRSIVGSLNRMRLAIERRRLLFSRELMETGARDPSGRSLHSSLMGYRWDPRGREEPLKDGVHDHACFPGDTPVLMSDGSWRRMDAVRIGDMVQTRAGARRVVDAAMTDADAPLWSIEAGGTRVMATGSHPFATPDGMRALDTLRYCDTVIVCKKRPSSSRAERITDTRIQSAGSAGFTSGPWVSAEGRDISTGTCTKRRTGRFQPGTSFTMLTTTRSTTTRAIWRRCRWTNTPASTRGSFSACRRTLSASGSIWTGLETPPASGTGARRAGRGTLRRVVPHGRLASRCVTHASNAALSTSPSSRGAGLDSAPTIASRHGAGRPGRMISRGPAQAAVVHSSPTDTVGLEHAAAHVASISRIGPTGTRASVYNITVEGEHEYCAAGFWVSNCDALRYGARRILWHIVEAAPGNAAVVREPDRPSAVLDEARDAR